MEGHQPGPDKIPEDDLDEDAVEPMVDPEESRDRINHIQCKDEDLSHKHPEEEAICEEKEGDWGSGPVPISGEPKVVVGSHQGEELVSNPTSIWVGGPVAPVREEQARLDAEREIAVPKGAGNLADKEDQGSPIPRITAEEAEQVEQTIRRGEQKSETEKEPTGEAKTIRKEQVGAESTAPSSVKEVSRPQVKTVKV